MRFARYDRIVEHYPTMWPLLVPGYVPILTAMHDIVKVRAGKPERLLDLGCGPGSATAAVAPACHADGTVTLVDGSKAMVTAGARLLGDHVADTVVGDFTDDATADAIFIGGAYDLALSSFALHHITDAAKRGVVGGLARSLRPGGMLLVGEEVASDRPAGWDMVERVRARVIHEHLEAGHISREFWELETSLPAEDRLPFLPCRIDDLTSAMAHAGLAVSCPLVVFGSALLVGLKS